MSLQTQVPADFLLFDGLEEILYRSRDGEDGDFVDSVDPIQALPTRGEVEIETDLGNVAAGRRTQVWWFRAEDLVPSFGSGSGTLDTLYAKPRDRIIRSSDSTQWEIWRVENRCLNSMYRVICIEVIHP